MEQDERHQLRISLNRARDEAENLDLSPESRKQLEWHLALANVHHNEAFFQVKSSDERESNIKSLRKHLGEACGILAKFPYKAGRSPDELRQKMREYVRKTSRKGGPKRSV